MQIIKRDGRKVDFDKSKIVNAISKAMTEVDGFVDEKFALEIAIKLEHECSISETELTVEQIQDRVEFLLMEK